MKSFREKLTQFISNNLVYSIFFIGLLTLLPYVTWFKGLEVGSTASIVYRGIIFCLVLITFIVSLLLIKKLPNKYVLIACGLYLITGILSIFVTPSIKNINVPVIDSLSGIAVIVGNIITVFTSLYLMNEYDIKRKTLNIMTYILIGFGIFLCVYSYIFQHQDIVNTFTKEYGWNYDVKSIFSAKTSYGFCLMFISIYTCIYALANKKYWFYVFPIFFLANALISRSKTSVLCICLLLIGILIYHLITGWKQNKKKWIIAFSIAIPIILLFILLTIFNVGPFSTFNKFIREVIIGDGITVTKDRLSKLSKMLSEINNPFNIIFGCGERTHIPSLNFAADNVYGAMYATGGLIKLALYLCLIVYIFYKYIESDNSKSIKFIQCLILSVYLIAGLFENDSLIGLNSTCLFILVAIYSSNSIFKSLKSN